MMTMTTILVDQDLCTRCGICSNVCTQGLIDPASENSLPDVPRAKAGMCIFCGHCEAYCPSQALLLNDRPDEKVPLPAGAGTLDPDAMGYYLRKRRTVRRFRKDPVPKETILELLDIARYAASGGNGQPVEWMVIHDPDEVRKIDELTLEWMKSLATSTHPIRRFVPLLMTPSKGGYDVTRGAPHLLIATIPEGNPMAQADAIIALTQFDIAAQAFGIGTCWSGFVSMAALSYAPLQKELDIPAGQKSAYAILFGIPQYKIYGIPRRKPLKVIWR